MHLFTHLTLASAIFFLLRHYGKSLRFHALIWWPSTAFHELAHGLIGHLLFAKPVGFSLIPKRIKTVDTTVYWQLGHVSFARLRWWNQLPVGLAPLILLPPLCTWLFKESMAYPVLSIHSLSIKFLAIQALGGAWPSPTDWAHVRHTITVLIGTTCFIVVGYLVFS